MNHTVLVSVIMPVYNSSLYLPIAIENILQQTYEHLELICIDDKSEDCSQKILSDYAKKDKRLRFYVNDIHCGAAESRNRGIGLSKGDYIYFVDSDDLFDKNLLEKILAPAIKEQPDMVFVNYDTFTDPDLPNKDDRHRYFFFSKALQSYTDIKRCPKEFLKDIQLAPYSRLYKKSFIQKNKLQFQNIKSSNDVYFGLMTVFLSHKIAHADEYTNLVHARKHGGRFRISNNRDPIDNFSAFLYLKNELKRLNLWNCYGNVLQEKFLINIAYELDVCTKTRSEHCFEFLKRKGLQEMLLWDHSCCSKLNPFSLEILNLFKIEKFDHMLKLYHEIDWFSCLIQEHRSRLTALFETLESAEENYAVWGAGKSGISLAKFCAEYHYRCRGFIDNNENKCGDSLYGYRIYAPSEILHDMDVIIITNQDYFNEICDQIIQMTENIHMISLDLYLRYHMSLTESCCTILRHKIVE